MGTSNLAPHHAELGVVDLFLGLVNVCNFLAHVELGVFLGADSVNLQQSAVAVTIGLAALVTQDHPLGVKSNWLLGLLHRLLFGHLLTSHHNA